MKKVTKKVVRKPRVKKPEDKFARRVTIKQPKPFLKSHIGQVKAWESNPKPYIVNAVYNMLERQGRIELGSPVLVNKKPKLDVIRETLGYEAATAVLGRK